MKKQNYISVILAAGLLLLSVFIGACVSRPTSEDETDTGTEAPGTETTADTVPPVTTPANTPASPPYYTFGTPLDESTPAEDDSVFQNAVFLGDSRTEGLQLWGGIRYGDYFWRRGMSVFRVDDENCTFDVDGEALTMVGVLQKKQYDQVYIMMGTNELGYPVSSYEKGLNAFLDKVIAAQPNAVIYLQTLPPLNDEMAQKHLAAYENNENVRSFNEIITRIAREKRVVLLDVAEVYRDEAGQLPEELTTDGCHFTANGYKLWADHLRCHRIDKTRYFDSRRAAEEGENHEIT